MLPATEGNFECIRFDFFIEIDVYDDPTDTNRWCHGGVDMGTE